MADCTANILHASESADTVAKDVRQFAPVPELCEQVKRRPHQDATRSYHRQNRPPLNPLPTCDRLRPFPRSVVPGPSPSSTKTGCARHVFYA